MRRSLALLLAACASAPPAGPRPPGDRGAAVRRADTAFSAAVVARDREAFAALVAEDAIFAGRSSLQLGREAVALAWERWFAPGAPSFTWAPTEGDVAGSGDLGWTTGGWRIEDRGAGGAPEVAEGRYLTVWIRLPDGAWRAAFDCGYRPAAELATIARTQVRTLASRDGTLEASMGTWEGRGAGGPARGAWLTVRERSGAGWRIVHDSAVPFAEAR